MLEADQVKIVDEDASSLPDCPTLLASLLGFDNPASWSDSVNVLVQLSLNKHVDLPHVPLIMDFAKTGEQKQIFNLVFARQPMGRPFLAPPGIPAERVAVLRKAFMDAMKSGEFLAEAAKMQLEINPVSGEAVQKIVQEVYRTPKAVAAAVAQMVN